MSVQDDTGETKLETRFVGNPVAIYLSSGFLVADRYATFPPATPPGPTLTIGADALCGVRPDLRGVPERRTR